MPKNTKKPALTKDALIKMIEQKSGNLSAVARHFGVGRTTIFRRCRDWNGVDEVVKSVRETRLDKTEDKLFEAIDAGSLPAIMFHLKTQGTHRGWTEKLIIEGNINITVINQLIVAIENAGLEPADVFEQMMNELANAEHTDAR